MRARYRYALAITASSGCIVLESSGPPPPTWRGDVFDLLSDCRSCHQEGGPPPDLGMYTSAIACRADGAPYARIGDPESLLLAIAGDPSHGNGALGEGARERLRVWVDGGLTYASVLAHPEGFAVPGSPAFHGEALRLEGYRRLLDPSRDDACGRCHDQAPERGGALPCASCHDEPSSTGRCDVCHGSNGDPRPIPKPCAPPSRRRAAGRHALHAPIGSGGGAYPPTPCATCHAVPTDARAPGHVDDGTDRAEVRFDPSALEGALRAAEYDPLEMTCAVACHGDHVVSWSEGPPVSEACDRCHGSPPASHASDRCALCHGEIPSKRDASTSTTHLNGVIDVGSGCTDCHGDAPAPMFTRDPTIATGAHEAHLSEGAFSQIAECGDCHLVPRGVLDRGHIDSDLPAEVILSGARATANGALAPDWDPERGRCSNVGCHGGALDGGAPSTPDWRLEAGREVRCGDCHGLPPLTVRGGSGLHVPTGPAECGVCHRTRSGEPITSGTTAITPRGRSAHGDGCVDLEAGCR